VVDTMQTLVAPNGGLRSGSAVPTFLKLLQSPACNSHARKLACVVIESSPPPLRAAMAQGGILRTLSTWLEPAAGAATGGDSTPLSLLLDALHKLPVTRQLVQESGMGKQVGALTKAPGLPEQLRAVATQVKNTWLAQVKRWVFALGSWGWRSLGIFGGGVGDATRRWARVCGLCRTGRIQGNQGGMAPAG
jgi:hypothetical protein